MRPPDSWTKARVTAGLALVTVAAWLVAALLELEDRAAICGGFMPGAARLADGPLVPFWLHAADRDPGPCRLRPSRSST